MKAGTLVLIGMCLAVLLILVTVILNVIDNFLPVTKGKWFCKHLGWHRAPKTDNAQGECPRCGAFLLKDTRGNWF